MNFSSIRNRQGPRSNLLNPRSLSRQQSSQIFRSVAAIVCTIFVGLCTFHATAADISVADPSTKTPAPISINLKQFNVINDAHGEVQFVDATYVQPGDVIEYRAVYFNHGARALPVVATMPVPENLEYLKDSANASDNTVHTVALKDSQYSKEPLVQKLVIASGATVSQPLPYASYRYVRWDLGNLPPGKSVEVSVRARVAQNLAGDATAEDKASALASFLSLKK